MFKKILFFLCAVLIFTGAAVSAEAAEASIPEKESESETAAEGETESEKEETPPEDHLRYGDADNSGTVDAADARIVLRASVGLETIEEGSRRFFACDTDYDSVLTAADARLILRASVDLEQLDTSVVHAHIWSEWKTVREPTCAEAGEEVKTCELEPEHIHVLSRSLPKKAHKMTFEEKRKLYVCSVCGGLFDDQNGERTVTIYDDTSLTPVSADLKKACDAICRQYSAVGAQAAVIRDGRVSETYVYGLADKATGRPVNEKTVFRAASLSKLVTDMVFFALQNDGKVNIEDDISKYFGYKCYNPNYPDVVITPAMLMSHTASFVAVGGQELIDKGLCSRGYYTDTKPGTKFHYSDIGIAVLACLCENASGKYLNTLAKEYIFSPLGLNASFVTSELSSTDNFGYLYGESGGLTLSQALAIRPKALGKSLKLAPGNINISAIDYAKIISVFLNNGRAPDGTRILTHEDTVEIMTERIREEEGAVIAFGNQIEPNLIPGKTVHMHTGSSYGMFSTYMFCPEDNAGVVVFTSGCARRKDMNCHVYNVCRDIIRTLYPA